MKVYFVDAVGFKKRQLGRYRLVLKTLKKLGNVVLVGATRKRRRVEQVAPLFPDVIYKDENELIDKADLIIVEVTKSSFEIGFLIASVLKKGKLVLGLIYKEEKPVQGLPLGEPGFLLEHYDEENLETVLKRFLSYVEKQKKAKGKLIVVDGTDGSGKAIQCKLLLKYLKAGGFKTKFIDFPRYYTSFHGGMVGRYLNGEFGGTDETNPYLVSLIYALDRLTAKDELEDWLERKNIVVANRYTSSNMAHQTAKLPSKKRDEFLRWLYEMEYKVHKLPKENMVVFLHLPVEIGQKLVDKKGKRDYVKGKKRDIHEASTSHLKRAEEMYLYLAKTRRHWIKVKCLDKEEKLRSRGDIHKEIVEVLKKRKIV